MNKPEVLNVSDATRAEILAKVAGKRVIVSTSGGKDSTATCLFLKELGIPFEAVFMDTGWEHKDTYKFLDEVLPSIVGPITKLVYDGPETQFVGQPDLEELARKYEARLGRRSAMVRLVIHKGMFPSRIARWCTQYLKTTPMQRYLRSLDDVIVNAVGIRAEESPSRAALPEWEWNAEYDADIWRPLIHWTENDVIDVHTWGGVPPNPLYLRGTARVGCWPCIFAHKAEIRMLAETDPERVALITDLERDVGERARQRYAAKGETFDSQGYDPPTWFVDRSAKVLADGTYPMAMWPIGKAVQWSKTVRGGKEEERFAPLPHERGCARWGLCESSWRKIPKEEEPLDFMAAFGETDPEAEARADKLRGYVQSFDKVGK